MSPVIFFPKKKLRCNSSFPKTPLRFLPLPDTDWPYIGICHSFFVFVTSQKILAGGKITEKVKSKNTARPEEFPPGRNAQKNRDQENHRPPKIRRAAGFVNMGEHDDERIVKPFVAPSPQYENNQS